MVGNFFSDKRSARLHFEGLRRSLSPVQVAAASSAVHQRVLQWFTTEAPAGPIALFASQSFEVNTRPLFEALVDSHQLVMPLVVKGQKVLAWHLVRTWADLQPGVLGLLEPRGTLPQLETSAIGVFLVPGVAFGRDGSRLGRGAGYYDATLSLRSPTARLVGLTFDETLTDRVPTEAHDVNVQLVATPSALIVS